MTQEVFRAVASGIRGFLNSPRGKFRGWLWSITRNKIADHFCQVGTAPQSLGERGELALALSEACSDDDSSRDGDVDVLIVQRTLELLRPEFEESTWQAFWRMTVGNKPAPDVAQDLRMTKKAVRQAKYRVLRRLRLELRQQLNGVV